MRTRSWGTITRQTTGTPPKYGSGTPAVAIATATCFLLVAFGGCAAPMTTPEPSDIGPVRGDNDLAKLENVAYNITILNVASGQLSQLTQEIAHNPDFMTDVRVAYATTHGIAASSIGMPGHEPLTVGPLLLTARQDTVFTWNRTGGPVKVERVQLSTGAKQTVLERSGCDYANAADVSPNGNLLAISLECGRTAGSSDSRLFSVNLETGTVTELTTGNAPRFVTDDEFLFVETQIGGRIMTWSFAEGKATTVKRMGGNQSVTRAWNSPDGTLFLLRSNYGTIDTGADSVTGTMESQDFVMVDGTGQGTILLRSRSWMVSGGDLSPDGRSLAIAIAGPR